MQKKGLPGLLCGIILVFMFGACASLSEEPVQPLDSNQAEGDANPVEQSAEDQESQTADSVNSSENVISLDESGVTMRVLWTVSGYQFENGYTAKTSDQPESMIFKPLDIGDTYIVFDDKVCKDVIFETSTVRASDYLANTWQETAEQLKVTGEEIQVFTTNCGIDGFSEYIRLSDGRLIVKIGHVFYTFDPAVTY